MTCLGFRSEYKDETDSLGNNSVSTTILLFY